MTSQAEELAYCSDLSLQAGEPLYGSAPQAQVYLLLEYAEAWGEKALEESNIPQPVKARLKELGAAVKGLKTLLIKTQPGQRHSAEIHFYVAALSAQPPRLYAFRFSDYFDMLGLDVPAILAGEAAYDPYLSKTSLYLVCGNGRRDRCCARHGVPVFNALTAAMKSDSGPLVWQCTHVGGHRFAANLLCLPRGLMYGRVRAEEAPAIIEADRNGQIYLPNLRGRVCDRPVIQATEYLLRQQLGVRTVEDIRPLEVIELDPEEWLVRFTVQQEEKVTRVRVRVTSSDERVFESCTFEKSTPIVRYELISIER